MNAFQLFITCKRTNNANNATHYVKLGKKRRKSCKRTYYIISPRVIIQAIIIILEGCSGKKEKTHCVMKPTSGCISARGQCPKNYSCKNFDRRKNPQDVQGLTLDLGKIITHYLDLC